MDSNYDKAFALYIEKVSGHLSAGEELQLQERLSSDAAFRAVWEKLEEEGAGVVHFLDGLDEQASLRDLHRQAGQEEVPSRRIGRRWVAAAAAVLLLVTAGYYLFFQRRPITDKQEIAKIVSHRQDEVHLTMGNGNTVNLDRDSTAHTVVAGNATLQTKDQTLQYRSTDTAQNTLSIPAGRSYRLMLSDGTEVVLNAATTLRFPFSFNARRREVWVDGEAYFKVAKDAVRPFVVHTPLTQIDVLGTSFNVNTYNKGVVSTSLVEGKVSTQGSDARPVMIQPGYAAAFQEGKGFDLEKFDQEDVLSWISGTYYFYNLPVDKLSDIIFRCYGLHTVLDKTKFANRSVTGLMDRNKLTEFLDDLETTAHIKYSYTGDQLHLE